MVERGKVSHCSAQLITTDQHLPLELRLAELYEKLSKLIEATQPQEAAIEKLFFNTNAKTAFEVGQARGVALLVCAQHHLPVHQYTPLQVKMAMTGYGRATKKQIQYMVKTLLSLSKTPPSDDVADAFAIALTHTGTMRLEKV